MQKQTQQHIQQQAQGIIISIVTILVPVDPAAVEFLVEFELREMLDVFEFVLFVTLDDVF